MGKRDVALRNLAKAGHPGRPKGSKDKFTNLKHAFLKAFEGIGGEKKLTDWASRGLNTGDFYKMIARMLPTNVQVDGEIKGTYGVVEMPKEKKIKKKKQKK